MRRGESREEEEKPQKRTTQFRMVSHRVLLFDYQSSATQVEQKNKILTFPSPTAPCFPRPLIRSQVENAHGNNNG